MSGSSPPALPTAPGKSFRLPVAVSCVIAIVVIVAVVLNRRPFSISAAEREKLGVVEKLESFKYPAQENEAKPFCTAQGFSLIQSFGAFPSGYTPISFKMNSKFCDIEMVRDSAEGRNRIHFRLTSDNGWKFHDVFFNEFQGRPCNLWATEIHQNPLGAAVRLYGKETIEGVATTTKSFVEMITELRKLDDPEERPRTTKPPPPEIDPETLRLIQILGGER